MRLVGYRRCRRVSGLVGALLIVLGSAPVLGNDTVGITSLEVKARIATMEQVNVTAEKSVTGESDAVTPASAAVNDLLAQLQATENELDSLSADSGLE